MDVRRQRGGLSTRRLSTRSRSRSLSDNRSRLRMSAKSKRVAPNTSSADNQHSRERSSSRASLRRHLPSSKSLKQADAEDRCADVVDNEKDNVLSQRPQKGSSRTQVTGQDRSILSPRQGVYSWLSQDASASSGHKGYEKTMHKQGEMTSSQKMTKKYLVEVDERMNILKLEEVEEYSAIAKNIMYKSETNSDEYDRNDAASSSFRHLLSPLRQSVGVEVKTRPSVLRSSSDRSFGKSPVGNRSVTFSDHNESILNNLKPASPVSGRVPKMVSNFVDFDPCLKESSSTQETVTIYDDDDDSLLEVTEYDAECQVDVSSNAAIIAVFDEIEEFDQRCIQIPTDLPLVPFPMAGASEDETSSLVTSAASCLEAQQKKSRPYKLPEGHHYH